MSASAAAPLARSVLGMGTLTTAFMCSLLTAFGALSLPSPALAQSAKPSRAWMKDMQALIDTATEAYGAARYEEALVSLRQAERKAEEAGRLDFLASIRFNVARCLEQLGRKKEALEAYRAYDKLPDLPHRKQKAFASVEKLQAEVLGVLAVTCQQEGSSVLVLEVSDAAQSCPFRSRSLDPGRYQVEVDAPGYMKSVRTVQVRAGATTAIDFDLPPRAKPLPDMKAPPVVVTETGSPPPPRWLPLALGHRRGGCGARRNRGDIQRDRIVYDRGRQ